MSIEFKTKGSYSYYIVPKSEIEKIDFSLCKQPTETLENFYKRQTTKPALLFNGGFFNMKDGKTIFSYRDENEVISTSYHKEGFGINKNTGALEYGVADNTIFKDFISGYPVFIADKKPVTTNTGSEINYRAKRTILAYDNENVYVIFSSGSYFSEAKAFLLDLGVTYAINLDGGGSSRCVYNGKTSINASAYSRPVDNVISIYTKKIIYRVQVGAFRNKLNAEALREKIVVLPDAISAGYKSAYIREIDGLYKVQVGAFGKKENAEKVLNDLKSKGYNAFIAK